MKHLLNDISQDDKNSILEQHVGGIRLESDNFFNMVNKKLGEVSPLISEQSSNAKQVAGPFLKKFSNSTLELFIFQKGSRFYVYVKRSKGDEPTDLELNNGQGYSNQKEAQKEIDNIIKNLIEVPKSKRDIPKLKLVGEGEENRDVRKSITITPKQMKMLHDEGECKCGEVTLKFPSYKK
jgi:hypothetical protein